MTNVFFTVGVLGAVHGWFGGRTNCRIRQIVKLWNGLILHLSWTSRHSVVVWLSVYVGGMFPKAFLDPNHGVIQYFKKFCNSSILHFVWFWSLFFHKNVLASIKMREERTNCPIGHIEEFLNGLINIYLKQAVIL